MSRTVSIRYPELATTLRATLLDDLNPDACDVFWDRLPYRSIQSHTMSSGCGMYAPHRIVAAVPTMTDVMTRVPVGTMWISMIDYKTTTLKYGEMTEPLPVSPIARVRDQDIEALVRVGEAVFRANFLTHEIISVEFARGGDSDASR
jgi:hypothetical protein